MSDLTDLTLTELIVTGATTLGGAVAADGGVSGDVNYTTVERTATADGTGTGTIAPAGLIQFVAVTSANAIHWVTLPAPTPGTIVILYVGANGCELRSSAPATVSINGGAEANAESALTANMLAVVICTSALTWHGFTITAATLAAIEAAAAT